MQIYLNPLEDVPLVIEQIIYNDEHNMMFRPVIEQINSNLINGRLRHITDHPVYVVDWQDRTNWRPNPTRFTHLNHH